MSIHSLTHPLSLPCLLSFYTHCYRDRIAFPDHLSTTISSESHLVTLITLSMHPLNQLVSLSLSLSPDDRLSLRILRGSIYTHSKLHLVTTCKCKQLNCLTRLKYLRRVRERVSINGYAVQLAVAMRTVRQQFIKVSLVSLYMKPMIESSSSLQMET